MKPPSTLDPCLSSPDEVAIKLKSYVYGDGNKLDGLLHKGELAQAAQLSLSVLKSANEKSDCGQTLDPDVKKLVRLRITKILNTQNSFLCSNLCRVSVADNNIRILIL